MAAKSAAQPNSTTPTLPPIWNPPETSLLENWGGVDLYFRPPSHELWGSLFDSAVRIRLERCKGKGVRVHAYGIESASNALVWFGRVGFLWFWLGTHKEARVELISWFGLGAGCLVGFGWGFRESLWVADG